MSAGKRVIDVRETTSLYQRRGEDGVPDRDLTTALRWRFHALAAAVSAAAGDLADVEERLAAAFVHSAAHRPHRAPDLLALAAQARQQAEQARATRARWHGVATGGQR
jgi:hypothetical protein